MAVHLDGLNELISAALSRSGALMIPEIEQVIAEDIARLIAQRPAVTPPRVGDRAPWFDILDSDGRVLSPEVLHDGIAIIIFEGGLADDHREQDGAAAYRLAEQFNDHTVLLIAPSAQAHDMPLLRAKPGNLHIIEDADRVLSRQFGITIPLPSGLQWALERVGAAVCTIGTPPVAHLQLSSRFIIDRSGLVRYASVGLEPVGETAENEMAQMMLRLSPQRWAGAATADGDLDVALTG